MDIIPIDSENPNSLSVIECFCCKDEEGELIKCGCKCKDLYVHIDCLKKFNKFNKIRGYKSITCAQCQSYYGSEIRSRLVKIPPIPEVRKVREVSDRESVRNGYILVQLFTCFICLILPIVIIIIILSFFFSNGKIQIVDALCDINDIIYKPKPYVKNKMVVDNYISERLYGQIITNITIENYDFSYDFPKIECIREECPTNITKTGYVTYNANNKIKSFYTIKPSKNNIDNIAVIICISIILFIFISLFTTISIINIKEYKKELLELQE